MEKGFTLLELLVGVSISTILALTSTPALQDLYTHWQSDAQARLIRRVLTHARHRAIIDGSPATFCGVDNSMTCVKSDFNALLVFKDSNNNRQLDNDENLISEQHVQFRGKVFLNRKHFTFKPSGIVSENGSIYLCAREPNEFASRTILVNRGGRNYVAPKSHKKTSAAIQWCRSANTRAAL